MKKLRMEDTSISILKVEDKDHILLTGRSKDEDGYNTYFDK